MGGWGEAHSCFSNPFQLRKQPACRECPGEWQGPRESLCLPTRPQRRWEKTRLQTKTGSGWDQARAAPPPASPISPHPTLCNQGLPAPWVGHPRSLCRPPWALESAPRPPHPRSGWGHRDTSAVLRLQLPSWPECHKQGSRRGSQSRAWVLVCDRVPVEAGQRRTEHGPMTPLRPASSWSPVTQEPPAYSLGTSCM